MDYPSAHRGEVTENHFGTDVADPYRWLEDADSEATKAFIRAQNELSAPFLAGLPERPALLAHVARFVQLPTLTIPQVRAGRYLAQQNTGEQNQSVVVVADSLEELAKQPRVLLDPNTLSDDGTIALVNTQLSPDGRHAIFALSDGGSDWLTLRVLDVATGEQVDDDITWVKFNTGSWLPDGSGFVYQRYDVPSGNTMSARSTPFEVRTHLLGSTSQDELLLRQENTSRTMFLQVKGHFLVRNERTMGEREQTIRLHRIAGQTIEPDPITLVTTPGPDVWVVDAVDQQVIVASMIREPMGEVVSYDLSGVRGDDALPEPTQVVGPTEDTLIWAGRSATAIITEHLHDASGRITVHPLDGSASSSPDIGDGFVSVVDHRADSHTDQVFLATRSLTSPGANWLLDASTGTITSIPSTPAGSGPRPEVAASVRRISTTSPDGSQVRAWLAEPEGVPDGPRPTLVYGYGGFNLPLTPSFQPMFAAWLAAGGNVAVVNLRGGGEYGDQWYEQGTKLTKQNVFDDLYAMAEQLLADKVAEPGQLTVHGRSNGGLLTGAALTQRPDLWGAALPTVGVLDMLRFHTFTIGWAWMRDYGSPEVEEEFEALLAYSPLHNVRPGVEHPPTLVTTADRDDRVVPAHSLKFAAELQHTSTSPNPLLLRVDTRSGHGFGKPRTALANEYADQLAFAAHFTGLVPRSSMESTR